MKTLEQPPFTPLRSGPRAASRPSRQKQIPSSLYFRLDTGLLVALDLIDARLVERTKTTSIIELHNPTAYPVQVRILTESKAEAAKPLPLHACMQLPPLTLAAGQTLLYPVENL